MRYKYPNFRPSFLYNEFNAEVNCMAGYKVEICGVNTAKLPVLKEQEKEELFKRIRQGDREARELYIKGNLRLVLSVIQRFSKGFQIEILNQETVAVVKNIRVDDLDFTYGCVRNIHD